MALYSAHYRHLFSRLRPALQRRFVSTSKKNNDTVTADVCKTSPKTQTQDKNWVSYGFEYESKTDDSRYMQAAMFTSITLCLVVGGFVLAYAPDFGYQDWSAREAFLELRRREAAGKPLVDPDFIPVDKIVLPSDEELGDTEIII